MIQISGLIRATIVFGIGLRVLNLGRFAYNFKNFGERNILSGSFLWRGFMPVMCTSYMNKKQSEVPFRSLANMLLKLLIFTVLNHFRPFYAFLNDFEIFYPFNFFPLLGFSLLHYSLLITSLLCLLTPSLVPCRKNTLFEFIIIMAAHTAYCNADICSSRMDREKHALH